MLDTHHRHAARLPHSVEMAHCSLAGVQSGVQGQDCFGAFMAWGLPKEVLREIWALVAGSQGQLDKHQFVSALYLMDSVKKVGKGLCASTTTT